MNSQKQLLKQLPPKNVLIMDDDEGSLNWYSRLLVVDPRTIVLHRARNPNELLAHLDAGISLDAILLDVEYPTSISVEDLIIKVKKRSPKSNVLCYSQYADPKCIQACLRNNASAFLTKREIRNAIVTAVILACRGLYVLSPAAIECIELENMNLETEQCRTVFWKPYSELTPALSEALELCILLGMSARLASLEIYKSPKTIETYIRKGYTELKHNQQQEGLENIIWENLKREDELFILYTQPQILKGLNSKP